MSKAATSVRHKQNDFKPFVHLAIVCLFMFGFRYLPPLGDITPYGMQVLGIFIGVLYGWTVNSKIWPSFLGIIALGFLEGNTVFGTLGVSFSDNLVLTTLFIFCFSAVVEEVGLSSYIANWCISRKFATGKPYVLLGMFCVAGAIISSLVNLFASMVLMSLIFSKFCRQAGFQKGDQYPSYGTILIIFSITLGGGVFPFMGQSYVVNTVMEKVTGMTMNFVLFTLIQIGFGIIAIAICVSLMKCFLKMDVQVLLTSDDRFACYRNDKMTGEQKQIAGLVLVLMVLLFFPGIMPTSWSLTLWLKNLSVPGAIVLTLALYYIINLGKTETVIPFEKLVRGINWDLIMMFATIAPIVVAVNSPESNIMPFIVAKLSVIFAGMGPVAFMLTFFFIAMVISQFINNVAVVLAFMPVMFNFGMTMGINPLVIATLASFCLNIAFCTPTASGNAAYIFSNKEWISAKDAIKAGLVIQVLTMILTCIGAPIIIAIFQ